MKKILPLLFAALIVARISFAQTADAPTVGTGTSGSPYEISTLNNLYWIADQVNNNSNTFSGKYFKQTLDIDASSTSTWFSNAGWSPIGYDITSHYFNGNYDGQNHKVSGLKINRGSTSYCGLFGVVYFDNSTIQNLGVTNANITGGDLSGILVGKASAFSTITNCWSSGTVSGGQQTGGLVGSSSQSTVTKCYSTAAVSGSSYIGGLIGSVNSGTVNNCYASGSVSGSGTWGGFCGMNENSATITNCYSTATVTAGGGGFCGANSATINYSFWDTQTSGTETSSSGTGKTTSLMKTLATFTTDLTTNAWNFTAGTGVWKMTGSNYPDLQSNPNSALPVELTSFTAAVEKGNIVLNWNTATELNNYGFEIQKNSHSEQVSNASTPSPKNGSVAQHDWVRIGFVEGNGTTNAPKSYSFTDKSASGKTSYRLKQIDRDGKFEYSQTVEVTAVTTPKEFTLEQNYPNPFNPTTAISYQLSAFSFTTLKIYDAIGREVSTLVNEAKEAGTYTAQFDGARLSSGIYFAKLTSDRKTQMKKLLLLK